MNYREKCKDILLSSETEKPIPAPTSSPSPSPSPSPTPSEDPTPSPTPPIVSITLTPNFVDFEKVEVGSSPLVRTVTVKNTGELDLEVKDINVTGFNPQDFSITTSLPIDLPAGAVKQISVAFSPTNGTPRLANLLIDFDFEEYFVALQGQGFVDESKNESIRINAGGQEYTDILGKIWLADSFYTSGFTYSATQPIGGSSDDELYQTERFGTSFGYNIPVKNGMYDVTLHFAEIFFTDVGQRVFSTFIENEPAIVDLDIVDAAGGSLLAYKFDKDVQVTDGFLNIDFASVADNAKISAIEVKNHISNGDPFLHVVIDSPITVIDYDNDGAEHISFNGSGSHTHEPGKQISDFTWTFEGMPIGNSSEFEGLFETGEHSIFLTIEDTNIPSKNLTGRKDFNVYPIDKVGGLLAKYYRDENIPIALLIDNLPSEPAWIDYVPNTKISSNLDKIGLSPFSKNTVIQLIGKIDVKTDGFYDFNVGGTSLFRIWIDDAPVINPTPLSVGSHTIEIRYGISSASNLPAETLLSLTGESPQIIPTELL
ncbi:MAG: choice-of-anchor D domain-containing protein, partial [Bdellovibrionales bacterium]|nr:choice-of-anchor D domain-containing protein [Bdellovibrionales bacterium]